MRPNLSRVISRFSQDIVVKKTTQTIVNYKPVNTVVSHNLKAVVQVANDETLQVNQLDTSKQYYTVHIRNDEAISLKINDDITYKNKTIRIVRLRDDSDYGFYKTICEEIK